ncbi:hypothetical protein CMI39_02465 [Candidatus Pacearchaeota archaeon]|jgi:2-oxoglutarate ferredoxin oxidoreductase subunit alpha|nr:hypothetical protein [Candidatus Pacearchaeota archaeon]|tara:strand:- start:5626 stop:7176 length:1551 start_codon:yes stop_codon:yes gene_type:complete
MKLNILIGGKAGQGINKISKVISKILTNQGYFVFNYKDYPSIIRGGQNFNILSVSDKRIGSNDTKLDIIISIDEIILKDHRKNLKKDGLIFSHEKFKDLGINMNVALAGELIKSIGIEEKILIKEIKNQFKNNKDSISAAKKGYDFGKKKFDLKKLNNKITIMSGSEAITKGAVNSGIDIYFAYPMTPSTGVMHELAAEQLKEKNKLIVFQPESEIAVANAALGASFAGSKVMIGTSGGGFDLMSEALSFQGQSEIPLTIYLASRSGPGTGVPTYTSQADLNIALRAGHGEFPRVVIAPGDPIEAIEKTNEALYLAEKFNSLSIILSDKHLAESEFSFNRKPNKILKVNIKRKIPGRDIVKSNSYEHDEFGNTTELAEITKKNAEKRIAKYEAIKKECKKFEMIKIYGNKNSKNLIISWGSTKTVILDALDAIDGSIEKGGKYKFLQVLYFKPMSNKIIEEIKKANKIILIENNLTGQLGRLIREKTGFKIKNRILKYNGRPFISNELKKEILKIK